jgi:RNA-directed DNA polymerase
VNTGASWPTPDVAEARVLEIQTRLHRWSADDPQRRFNDLANLVSDPAFLVVAWRRVAGNRGSRTAGVDGYTVRYIRAKLGEEAFLSGLRDDLKARTFRPMPVRERMIPKPNGKQRRLGIPTVRDRVVQAALKLVLEPIFEADFKPCSYGFRRGRRTHDAIAEIHNFATNRYEWVVEGDITACFDEISHSALMDRVRKRIGDKRVLGLVKAFLKSGILHEDGNKGDTITGTPQGGILSPVLANIALSVLDEFFMERWVDDFRARELLRRRGQATYRIVRYADDFVVMVHGTREQAEAVRDQAGEALRPMGLRLSETKTKIAHIDEGFDFLGYRIQRSQNRGNGRRNVYTYPSRDAILAITRKVKALTGRTFTNLQLSDLLYRLNPMLRGWAYYFRYGFSSRSFGYLEYFAWQRVVRWLRAKHKGRNWKWLRRRYLPGWRPTDGAITLFDPRKIGVIRYRYRGSKIPTPWASQAAGATA